MTIFYQLQCFFKLDLGGKPNLNLNHIMGILGMVLKQKHVSYLFQLQKIWPLAFSDWLV